MRRSRSVTAAVTASVLLASACTPGSQPTPPPTPSPTFTCSSSTVADPCTAEKAEKEKAQAAAVAASVSAYQDFFAEYIRVTKAGGAPEATTTMERYADGPYLSAFSGYVREIHKQKLRYSGDFVISPPQFQPGVHRDDAPGGELAFKFCVDGRKNRILEKSGKTVGRGVLIAGTMYFRRIQDEWKIWDSNDKQASQC